MLLASRYGTVSSAGGASEPVIVVAGTSGAAVSTDGTNWTYTAFGTTLTGARPSILRSGNILISGVQTFRGRYSNDNGLTYSNVQMTTNTLQGGETFHAGAEYNGTYVIGGGYISSPVGIAIVMYSNTPGGTWNQETLYGTFGSYHPKTIIHNGSQWIAGTGEPSPQTLYKATTVGTGSWTTTTTPFNNCTSIAFDGTNYLLATNSTTIYQSTNLTSFTARSTGSAVQLVAMNNSGRALGVQVGLTHVQVSTNYGTSWTSGGTLPAQARNIRYCEPLNKFVVTSTGGNVYTSTDGASWTTSNIGVSMTLDALAVL